MTIYLIEYFSGDRWIPAQYVFFLNNELARSELEVIRKRNRLSQYRVAEYIFNKDM